MADLVQEIRRALREHADPDKAPGMQAYMKSEMPCMGVQKAARTEAMKPILAATDLDRQQWLVAARALWDDAQYREERYAALALLRVRRYQSWLTPADEPLLRHLIITGAWWDLVDEIATKLVGPVRPGLDIRAWAGDENLWIRRAAILCQIGANDATDPDLLAEVIEANTADRTFWITKAIGWALRDYAYTDPLWVRRFVVSHPLAPLSIREATKHL